MTNPTKPLDIEAEALDALDSLHAEAERNRSHDGHIETMSGYAETIRTALAQFSTSQALLEEYREALIGTQLLPSSIIDPLIVEAGWSTKDLSETSWDQVWSDIKGISDARFSRRAASLIEKLEGMG